MHSSRRRSTSTMALWTLPVLGLIPFIIADVTVQQPMCSKMERVVLPVTPGTQNPDAMGLTFTEGTYWHQNGITYGCPCKIKSCITECFQENISVLGYRMNNITVEESDTNKTVVLQEHFFLLEGHPPGKQETCFPFDEDEYKFFSNGSLKSIHDHIVMDHSQYCLNASDERENGYMVVICEHAITQSMETKHIIYSVTGAVSIFFLLLVVGTFLLVPEMRTLQGTSFTCQSATLAGGLICIILIYIYSNTVSEKGCQALGFLAQFFMMSSFCWLTTMCYNMFRTFSALREMAVASSRSHIKKLRGYSAFAILAPLGLTVAVIIFQFHLDQEASLWPGIGRFNCWFHNRDTEFAYFQGPLLLILICNSIFFTATLVRIYKMRRDVAYINSPNSKSSRENESWQNFWVTVKLFLLMGGTWFMEFVSWAVNGQNAIWIVFDIVNILRGPFFFYVCVVGNTRVRRAIATRFLDDNNRNSTTISSTNSTRRANTAV